jgi:hypothetical protein
LIAKEKIMPPETTLDTAIGTFLQTHDFTTNQPVAPKAQASGAAAATGGAQPPSQAPVLKSITITPADQSIECPSQLQLTSVGELADGSKPDMTSTVEWKSSAPDLVSFDKNKPGLASGHHAGTVTITAKDAQSGVAATTTITVLPPVLLSITIEPQTASIIVKEGEGHYISATQPFSATGQYSDGQILDVTSVVNWHSSNFDSVSVDEKGVAHLHDVGRVTITATAKDWKSKAKASADLTVKTGPVPSRLIQLDLKNLKNDLKSTRDTVKKALDAENEMDKIADDDVLKNPDTASAGMKLTPTQRDDLNKAWVPVEQQQEILNNFVHQLQNANDALDTEQQNQQDLGNLPKDRPSNDEKKAVNSDATSQYLADLVDGVNQYVSFLEDISDPKKAALAVVHLVFGADMYKDWIKGPSAQLDAVEKKLEAAQDRLGKTIGALEKAAARSIRDKTLAVKRAVVDVKGARDEYRKLLGAYAGKVTGLSTGPHPAIPPQLSKIITAIRMATQRSQNARSKLMTQTLAKDKYIVYLNLLKPPGTLAPVQASGGITYVKGDSEYYYPGESEASLEAIVPQLESVQQVHDHGKALDDIAANWQKVLNF